MMIEIKRSSTSAKDKQRLAMLEETPQQLQETYGFGLAAGKTVEN
jgi:hypothetical protein